MSSEEEGCKDNTPEGQTGADIRARAEEMLRRNAATLEARPEDLSPEETRRVLHELQVHQIELEMQNEELHRSHLELDAARARYFDLYDLAPVGYLTVDGQWLIREANLNAASLLGVARAQLVHRTFTSFVFREDEAAYYGFRKRLDNTGEPQTCELRMVRKDGTVFWAHLDARVAQGFGDSPTFLITFNDITVRKLAELAQNEQYINFRAFFETSRDLIAVAGIEGRILFANQALQSSLGYSIEELAGMHLQDLHPADIREEAGESLTSILRGELTTSQLPLARRNGKQFPVESHFWFGRWNRTDCLYCVSSDLSAEREAYQLFERLFRHSPALMALTSLPERRFTDVNDAWLKTLGYSREEVIGRTSVDLGLFPNPEDLDAAAAQLLQDGSIVDKETKVRGKHGKTLNGLFSGGLIRGQGQDYLLTLMVDISDRERIAEALKESEERLSAIARSALDGIIVMDPHGAITYWNPAAESILGYRRDEAIGKNLHSLLVPERYDETYRLGLQEFTRSGRGNLVGRTVESVARRKDGNEIAIDLSMSAMCVRGEWHAVGIMRDITERKRTHEALRASEERYRSILDSSPDAIAITDLEGRIVMVSPRALSLYGCEREEQLVGHAVLDFLIPEDRERVVSNLSRMLLEHHTGPDEYGGLRPDGSVLSIEVNGGLIRGADELPAGRVFVVKDITARVALESQLRQAQKMESIGRLAGGIAHDFNNLLTVINGYSNVLLNMRELPELVRADLKEINKAGERAAELTRQLLAFSRKQVLQPKRLDLNRTVEEMLPMLARLLGERFEVSATLNAKQSMVLTDPSQLEQAIMNLALNARDAMPDGGSLRMETACVERSQSHGKPDAQAAPTRYAMLMVSDTGVGMDAEVLKQIFEPFFTTKGVGKGSGLGLSMVQGFLEQSGGSVEVESEPGQGTSFRLYLPVADAAVPESRPSKPDPEHQGKETVLVVDDDAPVRRFTAAALRSYGYRVIEAADGDLALAICESEKGQIALVITDVIMPGITGSELSIRIGQRWPAIRVLLMSGYDEQNIAHHATASQSVGYIQKPFGPDDLAAKIRTMLNPGPGSLDSRQ